MTRRPVRSAAPGSGPPRTKTLSIISHPSSTATTPASSAYPSTYASEAETDDDVNKLSISSLTLDTPLRPLQRPSKPAPPKPFPFLSLPSELRIKIYAYFFSEVSEVLDLGPDNYKRCHKKLGLMRTCRQINSEATFLFYSSRTFRLFPTYPGRYFKSKKPILARLSKRQRQCLTSIELRLGPGWSAPPRGWVVNDALGLSDCVNVRTLNVFVEIDPGDGVLKNFRRADGFYEGFSHNLLLAALGQLPSVHTIRFDAWPSVTKKGPMMRTLFDAAKQSDLMITWGPERGWTGAPDDDNDEPPAQPQELYIDGIPISGFAAHNVVAVA